jgi:hypothetical protein
MVEGGYLDPAVTRPYGGSKEKKEKTSRRTTEHQLSHWRKHGG